MGLDCSINNFDKALLCFANWVKQYRETNSLPLFCSFFYSRKLGAHTHDMNTPDPNRKSSVTWILDSQRMKQG
jgi:hypothetical protein